MEIKRLRNIIAAIALLACAFPPWVYTAQADASPTTKRPAGYSFIFSPPEPRVDSFRHGVEIDYGRLALELLAIAIAFVLANKSEDRALKARELDIKENTGALQARIDAEKIVLEREKIYLDSQGKKQ